MNPSMNTEKKTIGILFGGCSSEYGVSLQSAWSVIQNLDRERYTPVLVGITHTGDWYLYQGDPAHIPEDTWRAEGPCTPVAVLPGPEGSCLLALGEKGVQSIPLDAVFPVLHGRNGEDGTVQGLFQLAGIPVVGCGLLASALCMDKDRAHLLVGAAGIRVPQSRSFRQGDPFRQMRQAGETLGYPLFVKPVKAGSSYGITKVTDPEQLEEAVSLALRYDDTVLLEEGIDGFEVGCAVLGTEQLTVGEPDEIELSQGFFDFTEKYTLQTSAIHVPARISPETEKRIKETAQTIYRVLDCQGFARVDLFLTPAGELVFNEVNTIPGFTSHSRYPNMMKAAGISFPELISRAIELAVRR